MFWQRGVVLHRDLKSHAVHHAVCLSTHPGDGVSGAARIRVEGSVARQEIACGQEVTQLMQVAAMPGEHLTIELGLISDQEPSPPGVDIFSMHTGAQQYIAV
jgi:hypothetical protein